MTRWITFDPTGKRTTRYDMNGYECCAEAARAAYGIPLGTWLNYLSTARKEPGALQAQWQMRQLERLAQAEERQRTTAQTEAEQWWFDTIRVWDYIPTQHMIVHPRLVWHELYVHIYLPEMTQWGTVAPLQATPKSITLGYWFAARRSALRQVRPLPPSIPLPAKRAQHYHSTPATTKMSLVSGVCFATRGSRFHD